MKTTMTIAGHEATVTKRDGYCMVSVALTVFDVVWVYFKDDGEDACIWSLVVDTMTRTLAMSLKQMRDEYSQHLIECERFYA